jgi:hypothetical protein
MTRVRDSPVANPHKKLSGSFRTGGAAIWCDALVRGGQGRQDIAHQYQFALKANQYRRNGVPEELAPTIPRSFCCCRRNAATLGHILSGGSASQSRRCPCSVSFSPDERLQSRLTLCLLTTAVPRSYKFHDMSVRCLILIRPAPRNLPIREVCLA